jgi:hypothetical protein
MFNHDENQPEQREKRTSTALLFQEINQAARGQIIADLLIELGRFTPSFFSISTLST